MVVVIMLSSIIINSLLSIKQAVSARCSCHTKAILITPSQQLTVLELQSPRTVSLTGTDSSHYMAVTATEVTFLIQNSWKNRPEASCLEAEVAATPCSLEVQHWQHDAAD